MNIEKHFFLIGTTSHAQGTQASHFARDNIGSNSREPTELQLKARNNLQTSYRFARATVDTLVRASTTLLDNGRNMSGRGQIIILGVWYYTVHTLWHPKLPRMYWLPAVVQARRPAGESEGIIWGLGETWWYCEKASKPEDVVMICYAAWCHYAFAFTKGQNIMCFQNYI